MDEAEWLASTDPAAMLAWIRDFDAPGRYPSDRKLRLWACACWAVDLVLGKE